MTDLGSRPSLPDVTTKARPDHRSWSMRWWQWVLLVVLTPATLAFLVVVWFFASFGGSCGGPVDPQVRRGGLLDLTLVWTGVTVAWGLWVAGTRMRIPVLLAGALCSLSALGLLVYGLLSDDLWINGFCF